MIATFALLLTTGMSLMWCLMPRHLVSSGFFRIQMLVTLGLSVLAGLTIGQLAAPGSSGPAGISLSPEPNSLIVARWLCYGIAGCSFLGSALWTLERRKGGAICAFLVCGLGVFALIGSGIGEWGAISANQWGLIAASLLGSAAILGGSVTAMLLGHWYLTAPTMSLVPLERLTHFFGAAVAIRLLISLAGLVMGISLLHGSLHWTWFSLRWLAGILAPAVMYLMTVRILKYRNTQAATGVLFASVILTFIGEMSAALLFRELHHPL